MSDSAARNHPRLFLFARLAWWSKPAIPVWGWREMKNGRRVRDLGRFTYYPGGF